MYCWDDVTPFNSNKKAMGLQGCSSVRATVFFEQTLKYYYLHKYD